MINQNNMFTAEVRNIKDPWKAGRVQIRIYGNHDNEQDVKDEHLPWATPIQPITSAATAKVGIIPTGMVVGSRILGFFFDDAKQYPIIIGTYSRAAKLSNSSDNAGGQEDLDKNSKGIDVPSSGHPEDNNKGKTPNNAAVGDSQIDPTGAKYNEAPFKDNGTGQNGFDLSRSQNAPNADKPTIAGVDPSMNLSSALNQVGSGAEVLPNLVSILNQVKGIMSMTNQGAPSGGGVSTTQSGVPNTVLRAFVGALTIFSNQIGFNNLLNILVDTFKNDSILQMTSINQDITVESITKLMFNVAKYGTNNLPYTPTPNWNVIPIGTTTFPSPIIGAGFDGVPDYYIQQYYSIDKDPYPGFIQWQGPKGDYVYSIRDGQPNYPSANDAVIGQAQIEIVNYLTPLFNSNKVSVFDLNYILSLVNTNAQTNSTNAVLGNNSSSNILGMALKILGLIGSMINSSQNNHLPNSVLNVGDMTQTLQKFTKNIGILQQMKNISSGAFNLPSALSSLSSLFGGLNSFGNLNVLSSGGLSFPSINGLLNSGISQNSVSNINNIVINNPNISSNKVSIISSVTKALETANNLPIEEIYEIQELLAEIIEN